MKRTLAIGDIHGCLTALKTLADHAEFSDSDTIITVGDYVDRGPDSRGVLDFLLDLHERSDLIALRGNHEEMMLRARDSATGFENFLCVGGWQTLQSYGAYLPDQEALDIIPDEHWDFLEALHPYHETQQDILVHANLIPGLPLAEQPFEVLAWEDISRHQPPHCSGKRMICGHTPQRSGQPLNLGHAVCIDTGAFFGGWLTCLDLGSGIYWQADQDGRTRKGRLGD